MEISYINKVMDKEFTNFCQSFEEKMNNANRKLINWDGKHFGNILCLKRRPTGKIKMI